jgi:hypothetical protein
VPPPQGIYGQITQNGAPVSGVTVTLQLRDGATSTEVLADTTDVNGNYSFLNAPTLAAGQRYFVFYPNDENDPSRVSFWAGLLLNSYTAGDTVNGTDFDIANIVLVSPGPASEVTLPQTFTWNLRPATPTDSYEFNLIDDEQNITYFYTVPPLGYVNAYTLQSLPGNMVYDEGYGWIVWAYGPGGSLSTGNFGASFLAYGIAFVESAAGGQTEIVTSLQRNNSLDLVNQRLSQPAP